MNPWCSVSKVTKFCFGFSLRQFVTGSVSAISGLGQFINVDVFLVAPRGYSDLYVEHQRLSKERWHRDFSQCYDIQTCS